VTRPTIGGGNPIGQMLTVACMEPIANNLKISRRNFWRAISR